jgi:general secretion pathway protein G
MNPARRGRAGFTLVELLMVILIISMLIALLLPAVNAARLRAQETAIKSQIEQLVIGQDKFKAQYGAYPPDPNWPGPTNSAPAPPDGELATALRRAFPRYVWTHNDITQLQTLDEAEILVLWLGGRWDGVKMVGFNADPRANPFSVGGQRTTPLVQFDETRLFDADGDGFPEYYPPNTRPQEAAPFVYFAARPNATYLDVNGNVPFYTDPRGIAPGLAVPYHRRDPADPNRRRFVNEDTYQLICAGIDNDFGDNGQGAPNNRNKFFPEGTGYGPGDNDNLTNFSTRKLGEAQP